MANIDRKRDGDTRPEDSSGLSAATIGRRIGMLAYWIVLVFILSAGAYSIIPVVFGSRKSADKSIIDPKKCLKQTRALNLELRGKANDFCGRLSSHKLRDWLQGWDERYRNVNAKCGAPDSDRIELKTLRDGLESMVDNCEKKRSLSN